MNFSVPQYIEIEDKVVGPFTFKQFVYLAGGLAICFLLWRFLPSVIAILFILPVAALAGALAFYKINNQPFIVIMASAIKYWLSSKLYVWKKVDKKIQQQTIKLPSENQSGINVPNVSRLGAGKLREIAWSLDVGSKMQ
ncbi:MAG TPA: PrgI family protein [Candidatus Paceibacterota bacterium]